MSHRNRARGSRRHQIGIFPLVHAPVVVEVPANAPPALVARVAAAIATVKPPGAIELVRIAPQADPSDFRVRGPLLAWDAPIGAGAREGRAMVAFATAFEAAQAALADDEAFEVALGIIHDGGHRQAEASNPAPAGKARP